MSEITDEGISCKLCLQNYFAFLFSRSHLLVFIRNVWINHQYCAINVSVSDVSTRFVLMFAEFIRSQLSLSA